MLYGESSAICDLKVIVLLDDKSLLPLSLFLIFISVGIMVVMAEDMTPSNNPHKINEPQWLKTIEEPKLNNYRAYDCNHGHRSFNCDQNVPIPTT